MRITYIHATLKQLTNKVNEVLDKLANEQKQSAFEISYEIRDTIPDPHLPGYWLVAIIQKD